MNEETYQYYLSKASRVCAQNERCEHDIRKKLSQWEVPAEIHDRIIDDLKKSHFINHPRYIYAFVRDKMRFNHWGKKKISHALQAKNLEQQLIREALEEIPDEQYDSALWEELNKKDRSIKTQDIRERKNKLCRYLLQKGFEYGKVFDFVDKKMEEREKEDHNTHG
jgi:regulatory protein